MFPRAKVNHTKPPKVAIFVLKPERKTISRNDLLDRVRKSGIGGRENESNASLLGAGVVTAMRGYDSTPWDFIFQWPGLPSLPVCLGQGYNLMFK